MNINERMTDLGDIGGSNYEPTNQLVSDLLGRTKRARFVHQGGTAVLGSAGAAVLALTTVQVMNTTDNDPALQDEGVLEGVIERVNDKSNIETWHDRYGDSIPTKIDEPVDIKPVIEKLEAAAQDEEKAKQAEEDAAKKQGEQDAAKTEAEQDAAAKKQAEQDAAKKKDYEKNDSGSKDSDSKDSGSKHSDKKDDDKKQPDSNTKEGWIDFDGGLSIVAFTDAATGQKAYGVFSAKHLKVGLTTSLLSTEVYAWHHLPEGSTFSGGVCTGATMEHDGKTKQYSCITNGWVYKN